MKVNYLNKKDLLIEIHKSKLTYCSLINSNYQDNIYKFYDIIVSSLDDIDKELIDYINKTNPKMIRDLLIKSYLLLVVTPHTQYFDLVITCKDLINQTMLDIDPAGKRSVQITHQLFIRRRISKRIIGQNLQKTLCLRL